MVCDGGGWVHDAFLFFIEHVECLKCLKLVLSGAKDLECLKLECTIAFFFAL